MLSHQPKDSALAYNHRTEYPTKHFQVANVSTNGDVVFGVGGKRRAISHLVISNADINTRHLDIYLDDQAEQLQINILPGTTLVVPGWGIRGLEVNDGNVDDPGVYMTVFYSEN